MSGRHRSRRESLFPTWMVVVVILAVAGVALTVFTRLLEAITLG